MLLVLHMEYLSALVDAGAGTAAHRSADNALRDYFVRS